MNRYHLVDPVPRKKVSGTKHLCGWIHPNPAPIMHLLLMRACHLVLFSIEWEHGTRETRKKPKNGSML